MASFVTVQQLDGGREPTTTTFTLPDITVDGADNTIAIDTVDTVVAALSNAVQGISRGRVSEYSVTLLRNRVSNLAASDREAQREEKVLISMEDDVTLKVFSMEVGCLDMAALTFVSPNSEEIVLTDAGPMENLVTQIETYQRSPYGNPVTVLSAFHVGRNR